ncbi:MAG: hypothetical protein ACM3PX_08160 [Omnitrophica WOR_2 bacterium]|jgi:hypothetical protein
MKKFFVAISLIIIVFSACKKEPDTITLVTNPGGNLVIKVLDEGNIPISKAKVYVQSTIGDGVTLFYDSTNNDGLCNVGKLLEGEYEYSVGAYKGNIYYYKGGAFQIVGGDSKTIEVNPFKNVTKMSVRIVDYYNNDPIPSLNVALIPHAPYYNVSYSFESLVNEAYFTGITDGNGWVTFNKVPYSSINGEYSVMVFRSSNEWDYPSSNNSFYLSAYSTNQFTVEVDL